MPRSLSGSIGMLWWMSGQKLFSRVTLSVGLGIVGPWVRWSVGYLICWSVGLLACWSIVQLALVNPDGPSVRCCVASLRCVVALRWLSVYHYCPCWIRWWCCFHIFRVTKSGRQWLLAWYCTTVVFFNLREWSLTSVRGGIRIQNTRVLIYVLSPP